MKAELKLVDATSGCWSRTLVSGRTYVCALPFFPASQ